VKVRVGELMGVANHLEGLPAEALAEAEGVFYSAADMI
jgi:hypothetical protein